jgi:hypothetical protein
LIEKQLRLGKKSKVIACKQSNGNELPEILSNEEEVRIKVPKVGD